MFKCKRLEEVFSHRIAEGLNFNFVPVALIFNFSRYVITIIVIM